MNRVLAVLMSVGKFRCFLFLALFFSSYSVFSQTAAEAMQHCLWNKSTDLPDFSYECVDNGVDRVNILQTCINERYCSLSRVNEIAAFWGYTVDCPKPQVLDSTTHTCKTPPPPTCTSPSFKKGKSVDAETGNQYQEVDYLSDGLSPLKLSRYFNSTDTTLSSFGMGWRGAYSRSLNLSDDVVEVIRDDGKSLTFNLVAGFWLPEKNVNAQLLQTASGWTYFSGSNELETYNSSGQLSSITDHSGLATTLHYDVEGHLVSVVNPLGRSLSFAYTDSLVNFVTVADGTVYQYDYDANRLVKVTYSDKNFHRYLYENKQNPQVLTGVVDGKDKRFVAKRGSIGLKSKINTYSYVKNPKGISNIIVWTFKKVLEGCKWVWQKVKVGNKNPNSKEFTMDSTQLGKKLGKHVEDFGGNPSNATDRQSLIDKINDIANNPDKIVQGTFKGQGPDNTRGAVDFRIQGNDVVVTTPDGSFVTILKDGVINNTSVKNALGVP
jgi:filamentous hemagglutinin